MLEPVATPKRPDLFDEEYECGCCSFDVGAGYAMLACAEHGGGARVVMLPEESE